MSASKQPQRSFASVPSCVSRPRWRLDTSSGRSYRIDPCNPGTQTGIVPTSRTDVDFPGQESSWGSAARSSYRELSGRLGAPGDFAQAYVIAHQVGHHVQTLLGVTERAQRAQQRDPAARNAVSVRVELQDDCFAGVCGHSAAQRTLLDPGDVEEGLRAAAAVGDDHIQKMAGRRVSPESFTHGSAAERARWFRRGLDTGSLRACDTFAID